MPREFMQRFIAICPDADNKIDPADRKRVAKMKKILGVEYSQETQENKQALAEELRHAFLKLKMNTSSEDGLAAESIAC